MLSRPRPASDRVDRNVTGVCEYTFSWSRRVRFVADLEVATLCRDLRLGWGVMGSSSSDHLFSLLGVSRTSASPSSPPYDRLLSLLIERTVSSVDKAGRFCCDAEWRSVDDGAVDWVVVDVGLGEFVRAGLEKEVEPIELNERSGGTPSDCEDVL